MIIESADHDPRPVPGLARAGTGDHTEVRYTVLSRRAIALWAVLIVAAGVGVAVWLLLAFGDNGDPRTQLDAVRTAGTLVVGAGGAAALLLAARRQRSTEIALKQKDRDQADVARTHALQERIAAETRAHQERVAAATEADASARRITDLYTKAVEQLGSDKAPVRLGGLYALERLAQDNPEQRQTISNVLCAYLRMPYQLPGEPPIADADDQVVSLYQERMEEREVRLAAQRLLTDHLHPGEDAQNPVVTFWADIDVNLADALLIDFNLNGCSPHKATFTNARFSGIAGFNETQFGGTARFDKAKFSYLAWFDKAQFSGRTWFSKAQFSDLTGFNETQFGGTTWFTKAQFDGIAGFEKARFRGAVWFDEAQFGGDAWFINTQFEGSAHFYRAQFNDTAKFDGVRFEQGMPGEVARFLSSSTKETAADERTSKQ